MMWGLITEVDSEEGPQQFNLLINYTDPWFYVHLMVGDHKYSMFMIGMKNATYVFKGAI